MISFQLMSKLTFAKVVKSYPRLEVPEDIRGEDQLKAWWQKQWNKERDVLHRVQFYRVGELSQYRPSNEN